MDLRSGRFQRGSSREDLRSSGRRPQGYSREDLRQEQRGLDARPKKREGEKRSSDESSGSRQEDMRQRALPEPPKQITSKQRPRLAEPHEEPRYDSDSSSTSSHTSTTIKTTSTSSNPRKQPHVYEDISSVTTTASSNHISIRQPQQKNHGDRASRGDITPVTRKKTRKTSSDRTPSAKMRNSGSFEKGSSSSSNEDHRFEPRQPPSRDKKNKTTRVLEFPAYVSQETRKRLEQQRKSGGSAWDEDNFDRRGHEFESSFRSVTSNVTSVTSETSNSIRAFGHNPKHVRNGETLFETHI